MKNSNQIFWTIGIRMVTGLFFTQVLLFSSMANAWQVPLEVAIVNDSEEKIYNRLVAGIETGATDGFDNLWDAQALISHPDPDRPELLSAYFVGEDRLGDSSGSGKDYLWKDIRGSKKGVVAWDITIESFPKGRAVTISWDIPTGTLKKGDKLVLRDLHMINNDNTSLQTEVAGSSSYVFVSDGDGTRSLSLVYSRGDSGEDRSGSGSGFGCGTVKIHHDDSSGPGKGVLGLLVLFSPLIFFRWFHKSS